MKTFSLLIFTLLFTGTSFLDELNRSEKKSLICDNKNRISEWGIDCAGNFQIKFTETEKINVFKNDYYVSGYLFDYEINTNKEIGLPGAIVSYGIIENGICESSIIDTTDNNGIFHLRIERKKGRFIQITSMGYKGVHVDLKN